jgi:RHS repeat-associated protein
VRENPYFSPLRCQNFGEYDKDQYTQIVHARMRDLSNGRWLQEDPRLQEGGQPNFQTYAGDDPTNETDPSGLAETPFLMNDAPVKVRVGTKVLGTITFQKLYETELVTWPPQANVRTTIIAVFGVNPERSAIAGASAVGLAASPFAPSPLLASPPLLTGSLEDAAKSVPGGAHFHWLSIVVSDEAQDNPKARSFLCLANPVRPAVVGTSAVGLSGSPLGLGQLSGVSALLTGPGELRRVKVPYIDAPSGGYYDPITRQCVVWSDNYPWYWDVVESKPGLPGYIPFSYYRDNEDQKEGWTSFNDQPTNLVDARIKFETWLVVTDSQHRPIVILDGFAWDVVTRGNVNLIENISGLGARYWDHQAFNRRLRNEGFGGGFFPDSPKSGFTFLGVYAGGRFYDGSLWKSR